MGRDPVLGCIVGNEDAKRIKKPLVVHQREFGLIVPEIDDRDLIRAGITRQSTDMCSWELFQGTWHELAIRNDIPFFIDPDVLFVVPVNNTLGDFD